MFICIYNEINVCCINPISPRNIYDTRNRCESSSLGGVPFANTAEIHGMYVHNSFFSLFHVSRTIKVLNIRRKTRRRDGVISRRLSYRA